MTVHADKSDAWKRAYLDCMQDQCENSPFACVGGLEARPNLVVPTWIEPQDAEEYLAGYRQAALEAYGPDWATCSFSWHPALTIESNGEPQ